jgi:ATP-dependent Clp protease ATP-binding subunit ClpC
MHQRLTDRARHVVVQAQDEARGLNRDRIDTGHILLALIHEEGAAGEALHSVGVTRETVLGEVQEATGQEEAAAGSLIPPMKFTRQAKNVLDLSLREALRLGDNRIGTEHILLAMIREPGAIATEVLARIGVDQKRIGQQLLLLRSPAHGERAHG